MDVELEPQDLHTRLRRLEERVNGLETQRRSHGGPTDQPAQCDQATDPDRFWALEGLKARISAGSAVMFTGAVTLAGEAKCEWQQSVDVDSQLAMDWALASDVLAALGNPVRLAVLREVLGGIHTVADLGTVDGFGTSGQLYHHLRLLVAAGWLRSAGRGRYEVPAARVVPLLVVLAAAQR
jgi:DNA-binding transcriptional ArsR family regulator